MKKLFVRSKLLFAILFFVSSGCSEVSTSAYNEVKMPEIKSGQLEKIASRKIYFGHQSVGENIVSGINEIVPQEVVKIIDIAKNQQDENSGFYHSRIGSNKDPKGKVDSFVDVIENKFRGSLDVAMLKLCYVDITKDSNVEDIFLHYKSRIDQLKTNYPEIKFVHITLPLKTNNVGLKTKIKQLIGKKDLWEYADNIKRNQYNSFLLNSYKGIDPIFDLAEIESTRQNDTRETFKVGGEVYYALSPEYTTDGGHLNALGMKYVGSKLLVFLSDL